MNKISIACVAVCVTLGASSAHAAMISINSGSLSVAGGGLVSGPGGWFDGSLNYKVSWDTATTSYLYEYTFDGISPLKNISHVITQVSSNFTSADLLGRTTTFGPNDALGSFGPGGSNPDMPGTIAGIKLHPVNASTFTWMIETTRAPMWGNFYAKDGKNKVGGINQDVYVYNSGFPSAMGATPPSCYLSLYFNASSCAGFLLVPDSVQGPPDLSEVPEPVSLVLFGTGLVAAGMRARRMRRS